MSLTAKLVAGAVCLLGLAQARAAPPAAKLPADGSWVGYHVNRERADGSKSTLKVTISFVGRKVEDEVACRWIEFQEVDDRGKIQLIQKCLVPEQRLRKDPNPLRHVLRYWERDVTGKVRHFDKHVDDVLIFYLRALDISWGPSLLFLPATKAKAKPLEKSRELEYQAGKLKIARGLTGHYETKWRLKTVEATSIFDTRYNVWFHRDLAMGCAAAELKTFRLVRDDQGKFLFRTPRLLWSNEYLLEDTGTKAKSALPQRQ